MKIKCKNCGTVVEVTESNEKSITCSGCGLQLKNPLYVEEDNLVEINEVQQNAAPTKFCTSCGSKIHANAVVCPKCGCKCEDDANVSKKKKSKTTAALLALFLGGIGVHKFYMGKIGAGICSILFCWTGIPSLVAFIEFIIYLCDSDEKFQARCN